MSTERIEIEIFPDGKVVVEAKGFTGKKCVEDLKWLDDLLGRPSSRTFKDEYRKVEAIKTRLG